MVNYKRVVCEVAVIALLAAATTAAPSEGTHYDQRQNGTENYRLNIDGVVIAVAPADSLLAAASDIDFYDIFDLDELSDLQKPKPPADKPPKPQLEPKPQEGKPQDKPQDLKPDEPVKKEDAPLSDVTLNSDLPGQKKEAPHSRKQEKAQRLKHRLANILMPLLRRTRHH